MQALRLACKRESAGADSFVECVFFKTFNLDVSKFPMKRNCGTAANKIKQTANNCPRPCFKLGMVESYKDTGRVWWWFHSARQLKGNSGVLPRLLLDQWSLIFPSSDCTFFLLFFFLRVGRRIADPSAGRLYRHNERGFLLCLDTPAVLTRFLPSS